MAEPCNLEVEQSLLGSLLSDATGQLFPQLGGLQPEHFSEPVHARIFDAIAKLNSKGAAIGPLALKSYFEKDASLSEIGGTEYIARLASYVSADLLVPSHAVLLRDLAARRAAITAADTLSDQASDVKPDGSFRPALAEHISTLQALFDGGSERKTTFTLSEANVSMIDRIERIRAGEADRDAIKTGIAALDAETGGLHRGEYIILGGRPSMGKTALAVQLASNIAGNGGGAFYESLEMPVALLTPRLASCRLWTPGAHNIDYQSIMRGKLSDTEAGWVYSAAKETQKWPLIIDDAPGLTPAEVEARAMVAKARLERAGFSLDLVVVDHLHKMRQPGCISKVVEYTEISARLAEMAKRLNCPVVALAQLNRSLENREDKRPQLSDLRESGSIEQDADTVLFVYRHSYYLERQRCDDAGKEADRLADLHAVRNQLEVIIEKQRSGPIGTIDLYVDIAANVVRDLGDVMSDRMAA